MTSLVAHLKDGKQILKELPVIEQLSPLVWRLLGGNPGSYTLTGTNTYLVGRGPTRILIDTGEGEQIYEETLSKGMRQAGCQSLSQIIISHWHHDHLGGVPQVIAMKLGQEREMIVPVRKYMPKTDPKNFGQGEASINPYTLWPKDKFVPMEDGEIINDAGVQLKIMYTPGHANDHVVCVLEEEQSMFTADNVLGTGTTVFNDLHSYMRSLRLMLAEAPKTLYPGHGPVVENGCATISAYIEHRLKRIVQAVDVLSGGSGGGVSGVSGGGGSGGGGSGGGGSGGGGSGGGGGVGSARQEDERWTLEKITRAMYLNLDERLIPPAMGNTYQVLDSLLIDGVVEVLPSKSAGGGEGGGGTQRSRDDVWRLIVTREEALRRMNGTKIDNNNEEEEEEEATPAKM